MGFVVLIYANEESVRGEKLMSTPARKQRLNADAKESSSSSTGTERAAEDK